MNVSLSAYRQTGIQHMRDDQSYVLVTPVRNEEATIGITLESVVRQTTRPRKWVIVSDGSIDHTDAIVCDYVRRYPFISFLRLESRPKRSFSSVVFATEAGIAAIDVKDYRYIGLLDADIRLPATITQACSRDSMQTRISVLQVDWSSIALTVNGVQRNKHSPMSLVRYSCSGASALTSSVD